VKVYQGMFCKGGDDQLAKHSNCHKENLTYKPGAKETTPLVERNRQPPRSLILVRYIVPVNVLPLRRFEPMTERLSL
jgi:hypothetical protein